MNRIFRVLIGICLVACAVLTACKGGACYGVCERHYDEEGCDTDDDPFCGAELERICFIADDKDSCLAGLEKRCADNTGYPQGTGHLHTNKTYFDEDCDDCNDDCVDYPPIGMAPNIYLYPEAACQVDVTLELVAGSEILYSMPAYDDGWSVWVEPSGLIDGTFDYLFYEALLYPDDDRVEGWAVESHEALDFFAETLAAYGFVEHEVADFVDFWSVNLPTAECYEIYPLREQEIAEMVGLAVYPEPDTVGRLWFVLEARDACEVLTAPEIVPIEREGFVVVEWGVVLP